MKAQYNSKTIGVAVSLTILICTGIYFYAQWDLTRFKASLGEVPKFNVLTNPASQNEKQTTEHAKSLTPSVPVELEPLLETNGEPEIIKAETDIENTRSETEDDINDSEKLIFFLEEPLEDILEEPLEPYDLEKVRAGFRDYNAFLVSNPERAYASLSDALREQNGNRFEVDIIVETVRRINDGITTVDDAIALRRAIIGLTPPENTEEIEDLSYGMEELYEFRALHGGDEPIEISITFGE